LLIARVPRRELHGHIEDPPVFSAQFSDDAADRTSAPLTSFRGRECEVIRAESGRPEDDIVRRCTPIIEHSKSKGGESTAVRAIHISLQHTQVSFGEAAVGTPVACHHIAVITLLRDLHNLVTASGRHTRSGTVVRLNRVPVITLLGKLDDAVATARGKTGIGTCVRVHLVAIVALFIRLDHHVSTTGNSARIGTSVIVDAISIVALFGPLPHPIATVCGDTGVGTGIRVDLIAVIALLSRLHGAISAARADERVDMGKTSGPRHRNEQSGGGSRAGSIGGNTIAERERFFRTAVHKDGIADKHPIEQIPAGIPPPGHPLVHESPWRSDHHTGRSLPRCGRVPHTNVIGDDGAGLHRGGFARQHGHFENQSLESGRGQSESSRRPLCRRDECEGNERQDEKTRAVVGDSHMCVLRR